MNLAKESQSCIEITPKGLTIEELNLIAKGSSVTLSESPEWRALIQKGADVLSKAWQEGRTIYGVTTGYGDSAERAVHPSLIEQLPLNLSRFHGCGFGAYFDEETTRCILAVRLLSLTIGASGVRIDLLQLLADLINHNILPRIPEEGSVGASGDLTPLSYIAATLSGEAEVLYEGEVMGSAEALAKAGLKPLALVPKEALAIMNGTSVMAAISSLVFSRASYLVELCSRITAMAVVGAKGNAAHFDDRIFQLKPHPGQRRVATAIREDLKEYMIQEGTRLQDRYSLRCAPHVIGVVEDALPFMRSFIETEANSANDNPLVDPETGDFLHGGNFYGGHIAFAMDSVKAAVSNLAGLMDRQVALLVDPKTNQGLVANLSGAEGEDLTISHGFKAVQIAISAMTAEAMKLTMPASVFSRSTECHNQDIVSMGTIAARDAVRVLELTEQCAAASLMIVSQAIELRIKQGTVASSQLSAGVKETLKELRAIAPFLEKDRRMEKELRQIVKTIEKQEFTLDNIKNR